ncbi:MAG: NAD(P)-dependent oxidoreductase [Clostridiaceae bacterium]|nr:NAD(P)-dependent oxidoreductase [Clostridiaceae bacterium]
MKAGFTTLTFRTLGPEEQIRLASENRLRVIEWNEAQLPIGAVETAQTIRTLTEAAGLEAFSYAVNLHCDEDGMEAQARDAVACARALGAKILRIWAGRRSPQDADAEYRARVVANARLLCDAAAAQGIVCAFEFHPGTLTETAASAVELLRQLGRPDTKCYWQSNPALTASENLAELRQMLPYLAAIHVFSHTGDRARRLLCDGVAEWTNYLEPVREQTELPVLIEGCMDGSERSFASDAATLRRLVLPRAVFLNMQPHPAQVFTPRCIDELERFLLLDKEIYTPQRLAESPDSCADVEYVFSTWGMPVFSEEEIARYFPRLRAVFYAAGSVQSFVRPYLARGVEVYSAASANAVPVAEYTAAQILLANKGFFQAPRLFARNGKAAAQAYAFSFPGNYDVSVGLIGFGLIGSAVARILAERDISVCAYDPYVPEERLKSLGVRRVSLPELFTECQTISNHLPNNAQTKGMLDYSLFSRMAPNATFLNTGRGAQIVEEDLIRALREELNRTAVLDVTFPEPPPEGHPFYTMDNVLLTPHIAGSFSHEIARMGEYMRADAARVCAGLPGRYRILPEMLANMA